MHALGWTTEQAVEFMLTHTAASPENIRGEVKMANQATKHLKSVELSNSLKLDNM